MLDYCFLDSISAVFEECENSLTGFKHAKVGTLVINKKENLLSRNEITLVPHHLQLGILDNVALL